MRTTENKVSQKNNLFKDVVSAAMEFLSSRLWKRVESGSLFQLILKDGEEYLAVLEGSDGEGPRFLLMSGPDRMKTWATQVIEGLDFEPTEDCDGLLLEFAGMSAIEGPFQRLLQESGHPFFKASSVPLFASLTKDRYEECMSRPQLRVFLEALKLIVQADRQGCLHAVPLGPKRRVCELRLDGHGKKARVVDRVVTMPALLVESPPPTAAPLLDLISQFESAARTQAEIYIGTKPLKGLVMESGVAEVWGAIESDGESIFEATILNQGDLEGYAGLLGEWFLSSMEIRAESDDGEPAISAIPPGVPARIIFNSFRIYHDLASTLQALDIEVDLETNHPILLGLLDGMQRMVENAQDGMGIESGPLDPDDLLGWRELDSRLTEKLVGSSEQLMKIIESPASKHFFGKQLPEDVSADFDEIEGLADAFLEWTFFEYRRSPRAHSFAETFLEREELSDDERTLLRSRIDSTMVPIRVTNVEVGATFAVENLLSGQQTTIYDSSISESIDVGVAFLLRIYTAGDFDFGMPCSNGLNPADLMQEIKRIQPQAGKLQALPMGQRRIGELFYRNTNANPPTLQNTDGDPLEMLSVLFRSKDAGGLSQTLGGHPEMVKHSDTDWNWVVERPGERNDAQRGHGQTESRTRRTHRSG